ncbi:hypothetical protein [Streptomyces sp. NPDC059063]|uniref:hypothetical protein n=1 Tax=unclassified Streptomyces TaxID=2593676 RepID=UPI00368FE454
MTSHARPVRVLAGAALLGSACTLVAPASAADARDRQAQGGGAIVSVERVADLSAEDVVRELHDKIDSSQVRHGVTAYRVAYRTTNSAGAPTTASQLVVLPRNRTHRLSTVSWLHGTTVYRKDVASENPASDDRLAAFLFASTGRAVSAPDCVGLGSGEGFHPYGDPRATVAASVDGLRAARTLDHRNGRELKRKVQVSGFSQGGPATMTVGRALQQEGADRSFRLGALAPVGGPFHLSAFEADAADDKIAGALPSASKDLLPVEIFHGRGDQDVDISHSRYCAGQLTKNGAAHRLTDVGDHDYSASVGQALPRIITFFDKAADNAGDNAARAD